MNTNYLPHQCYSSIKIILTIEISCKISIFVRSYSPIKISTCDLRSPRSERNLYEVRIEFYYHAQDGVHWEGLCYCRAVMRKVRVFINLGKVDILLARVVHYFVRKTYCLSSFCETYYHVQVGVHCEELVRVFISLGRADIL